MTIASPLANDAWKPCDVRGVFPDAVSPALFRRIGGAVATLLPPAANVVVAGDYRISTPELKRALIEGLTQSGATVLDTGQGPTPYAYFATRRRQADAVLIVTASHNPPAHNGLKIMLGSAPMTPQQLSRIRTLVEGTDLRPGKGNIELIDLRAQYLGTMLQRWESLHDGGSLRVVLDAGNGAWSELAPPVFRRLGFEVSCLSCTIDGTFPDRPADCTRAENLTRLRSAVLELRGAIGIAWDGDGDRAAFVDEDGGYVSPDEIAILLARHVLSDTSRSNGKVVVDLKHSDTVRRAVLEAGGIPLLERTGHAFMRSRMVAEHALLGLDACGHYFFQELDGGDDGLFSALYLLDVVRRNKCSLRDLRRSLPSIFSTPELRIPASVLGFVEATQALQSAFPSAAAMHVDGLRLLLSDGIVLIRESGTEPVLSLRIEGFDQPGYHRIRERCLSSLPALAGYLHHEQCDVPVA